VVTDQQCSCGNAFVSNSLFCHKCGEKRPDVSKEHDLQEGDEVVERSNKRRYTVTKRTKTDVCLKPCDGSECESWKSASAVDKVPKLNLALAKEIMEQELLAPVHEARCGDQVQHLTDPRKRGNVLKRTTTDVLLRMEDGTEGWEAAEDLQQVLSNGYDVTLGEEVISAQRGTRGSVKNRTTTEILVLNDDGTEEWHEIESIGRVKSSAMLLKNPTQDQGLLVGGQEDMDEEAAKENAREALTAALLGGYDEEEAKANARSALTAALFGNIADDDDEEAKANARDALTAALLGDADEDAKANAREALTAALLGSGEANAKGDAVLLNDDEVEEAKNMAREALMAALLGSAAVPSPEQASSSPAPSIAPFRSYYTTNKLAHGARTAENFSSIYQLFGKPKEPKDEPPAEAQKKDEPPPPAKSLVASNAIPVVRSTSPARSQALSAASFTELEDKIRVRNERFRVENDTLKKENRRLKALLDKKHQVEKKAGPDAS